LMPPPPPPPQLKMEVNRRRLVGALTIVGGWQLTGVAVRITLFAHLRLAGA